MTWPAGYERRVLAEVDSTMAEAARLAPTVAGPVWVCARHQTAARGRRGRAWVNPAGNFAATLVLPSPGAPGTAALRSFVAALALFDAVVGLTGRADGLALKWPNDVMLNGGKLAGILLEMAGPALFVGVGVNLVAAPDAAQVEAQAMRPVALLSETGAVLTPDEMLDALAASFAQWDERFTTYGFEPVRTAWLARAARLGQVITARTGTSEITGTFETVDEVGQLVLKTPKGRVAIPAADVYF